MLAAAKIKKSCQIWLCINIVLQVHSTNKSLIVGVDIENYLSFPVVSVNSQSNSEYFFFGKSVDFFIINSTDNMTKIWNYIHTRFAFNSKTKFIFIRTSVTSQILQQLANHFFINVLFLDPSSGNLLTYNPYKNRILYEVGLKPDAVGNCKDAALEESLLNVFKVTPPNKWTNTSILIGYSYAPPYTICSNCSRKGIEFEAHFMMMEKMNITGNYIISDFAKLDYDNHVEKLFSTTKYDIILNGVFVKNYDYTKPFHDYYYMYAPCSNKISNWKYIIKIFQLEVWLALTFTVLCICSTWYIINMFSTGEYHPKYILQKLVAIYIVSLDQNWYFQMDYLHHLVLYTIIKVFCFVVFLFWKSEYTHRLTQYIYENDITSMSEVMEKELLVGFPYYRFFLFEENPKVMDYLNTHFVNCNHSDYCLEQAAYHRNMVTPRVERYFNFIQHKFLDEYGRSLMKKMKYPLLPIQYVQVLPKGHILTHIISKQLEDLRSHGFVSRLMKKYDELSLIQPPLYNSRKKLKLEHIEAPLGLWLMGNLVGLVVFSVEKFILNKNKQ